MAPPTLTQEQKKASILKRKAYQKEYHKAIPIELKRIYRKATTRYKENEKKQEHKQVLKNQKKTI